MDNRRTFFGRILAIPTIAWMILSKPKQALAQVSHTPTWKGVSSEQATESVTKYLKGTGAFPEDVAAAKSLDGFNWNPLSRATRLTAYNFSSVVDRSPNGATFSIDSEKVVAQLRDLANKVESRHVLPQRVQVISEALVSEYPMTAMIFEFYEYDPSKPKT